MGRAPPLVRWIPNGKRFDQRFEADINAEEEDEKKKMEKKI